MAEQKERQTEPTTAALVGHKTPDSVAARMQDLVLDYEETAGFLTELAVIAAERCSTGDQMVECGITVVRRRRPAVAAVSGPRAQTLDELQNRFGDGPCLTALREQQPLLVQDLEKDGRWPGFAQAAAASGVGSILAVPLLLEGEAQAVLNLYAGRRHGFSPEDVETVRDFVAIASRSLRLALVVAQLRESKEDLAAAMQSRTMIDIAIGAVMSQNRCTKAEAFQILVRASNARNIKLKDVAAGVIDAISGEQGISTHFDD